MLNDIQYTLLRAANVNSIRVMSLETVEEFVIGKIGVVAWPQVTNLVLQVILSWSNTTSLSTSKDILDFSFYFCIELYQRMLLLSSSILVVSSTSFGTLK